MMGLSYIMLQAMSPDGQTIVTGAGDETLRFWNVFSKARSHKVCLYMCQFLLPRTVVDPLTLLYIDHFQFF